MHIKSKGAITAMLAAVLLLAPVARGITPADKCEATKLGTAGKYDFCRLKAEAKAVKTGGSPDFTKCDAAYSAKWTQAETNAGGMCPSNADEAAIQAFIAEDTDAIEAALDGGTLPEGTLTCNANLATCNGNLSTCTANDTTCNNNLSTCTGNLSTCNSNYATCTSSLSTCTGGTAGQADVLSGKTFSSAAGLAVTGTMPNIGQQNVVPGTSPITIARGYHDGTGTVAGDPNLVSGNIVEGVRIFGVTGSALPGQLLKTGQTQCFDSSGAIISCAGTGQDGELQKGATRLGFTDNDDGTITDNQTGLMWEKKDRGGGIHDIGLVPDWQGALNLVSALNNRCDDNSTDCTVGGDTACSAGLLANSYLGPIPNIVPAWSGTNLRVSYVGLDVPDGQIYWFDRGSSYIQTASLTSTPITNFLFMSTSPSSFAIAGGYMYIPNPGVILQVPLSGGTPTVLISGLGSPGGVAIDETNDQLYWTDASAGKIQRAPLAGGVVTDVITGLASPFALALDVAGGQMYWTDNVLGRIQRAPLGGGSVTNLITGLGSPVSLALDVAADRIYWSDTAVNGIYRGTLSTGLPYIALFFDGLGMGGIALDIAHRQLYWAAPESISGGTGYVRRADITVGKCGFAGHRDWRLPNINELQSLADFTRFSPALDPVFDHDCNQECGLLFCSCDAADFGEPYWSSTTRPDAHSVAFTFESYTGTICGSDCIDTRSKSGPGAACFRAVRGGS